MKGQPVDTIRNVGLISHGGAGKTSLAEAMLYDGGVTDRLGRVDDGTTVMDHDPEEVKRKITISTSIAPCPWRGARVNIVDTPGYFDFAGEVRAALRVVDGAIVVVDAVAGVEVGTELVWRYADEEELPRVVVVNKMERENAGFFRVMEQLQASFGTCVMPLHIPVGQEAGFKGVVDLVEAKAYLYGDGGPPAEAEIPLDLTDEVAEYRETLIEAAVEGDDDLLAKYLEGEALTGTEVKQGLRQAVLGRKLVPVLCVSALKNIGVHSLLDAIVDYLPSPADTDGVRGTNPRTGEEEVRVPSADSPFSALVFKTMADPYVGRLSVFRVYSGVLRSDSHVYNASKGRSERIGQLFAMRGKQQEPVAQAVAGDLAAVAKLQETTTGDTLCDEGQPVVYRPIQFPDPVFPVAVQPKAKGDEEKIGSGLARLMEEDPSFKVEKNAETGQMVVYGMGELHLDIICERLRRKFGVEVTTAVPKVPYRETIRSSVKMEGKYKKQTGGRGQYGHVWLTVEPLPDGEYEFVDKIFGGVVPQQYRPAVDKGVREAMQEGILAGYPVTGVRVTLVDGSYHTVDSSEMAFKIAASMAFKKAAGQANPVLLEPIMNVEVMVPEEFMGDVIGDLNKKRGKILGMEPRGTTQVVKALAPLAEMFRYAVDLRSITQGRGTYTMGFSHYEEVPHNVAQEVITRVAKEA